MARAGELSPDKATVALSASTPFIRLLESQGASAVEERSKTFRALLHRFDVNEETLDAEGARVPHDLSLEILLRSAWLLRSDAIAVRSLRFWKMGDHELSDYLHLTCATIRDFLETITEYVGLLHDGVRFAVRKERDLALFACELDEDVARHHWYAEIALGKVVVELRHAFSKATVPGLLGIRFAHHAPAYEREYAGVYGVPVGFAQGEDALVFQTSALDTPLPTADPVLHGLLVRLASATVPTGRMRRTLVDRVTALAREELSTSLGSQARIAERLGMSASTLRRRLEQEHGVHYSQILSEIRKDVAVTCLANSALSIDEIGRRVGFSQKTAFYRAFKSWLGCTPVEYRKANRRR